MTTGSIIAIDLTIAVLAAAGWLGAGTASAARRRPLTLGLAIFAVLATLARAITITALARAGWWFAAEKILIAAPLSLAALVATGPRLLRAPGNIRSIAVPLLFAGYAESSALLVTLLHGYPATAGAALLAISATTAATAITWRILHRTPAVRDTEATPGYKPLDTTLDLTAAAHGPALPSSTEHAAATDARPEPLAATGFAAAANARPEPRTATGFAAVATPDYGRAGGNGRRVRLVSRVAFGVAAVALVAGIGAFTVPGGAQGIPHDHGYLDARTVGEPARRWTLTAGTAMVNANGRDVAAWAFNEQVPGPELTATVGEVLEITLRNRDIGRGVTLHWHGYDVPNGQDGVPGVTQDAVLPGQEFVYRFRAEQAGTYWYHTHSASDIGVRMGLYGVLVVRPGPATGVDVTIPVHTLAGVPLPVPRLEPAEPGVPVRLRLINTDSTTHRYALAGTSFQVTAIDGSDLQGPPSIVDTAIQIPAGGRFDLSFTAPATPVGLFTDGRLVYSTGPVSAATGKWPVLDPLSYGTSSPVPWPGYSKHFTLVLDRGLDLGSLLPRYAHTVNGAAGSGIPPQVVGLGDIVKFTIVNRSLVVHPWHLHGHHVLVLSRNGKAATGSPLWLDSFDILPGEVWEVAFAAGNPGMWANHCHNLEHADAGMILHLMYS